MHNYSPERQTQQEEETSTTSLSTSGTFSGEFKKVGLSFEISIMDFIKGNSRKVVIDENNLSSRVLLILQFSVFISISLYRWMYVHFLKKSQTYFIHVWFENFFAVCLLYLYLKRMSVKSWTMSVRHFQTIWLLIILYAFQVVVNGLDFITFTRKAGGTEFYQFNLALSIPVLLAVIHFYDVLQISPCMVYTLVIVSGSKMMFLLQDQEFLLTFSGSIWCLLFTFITCFYLVLLKAYLRNSVLEILYYLSLSLVLILPVLIVYNNEIKFAGTFFTPAMGMVMLIKCLFFAILKIIFSFSTMVLLKNAGPLMCLIVTNLTFLPDHFNQALVYKLDCTLAASKVCIFNAIDYITMLFKPPKLQTSIQGERNFTLMS